MIRVKRQMLGRPNLRVQIKKGGGGNISICQGAKLKVNSLVLFSQAASPKFSFFHSQIHDSFMSK